MVVCESLQTEQNSNFPKFILTLRANMDDLVKKPLEIINLLKRKDLLFLGCSHRLPNAQ